MTRLAKAPSAGSTSSTESGTRPRHLAILLGLVLALAITFGVQSASALQTHLHLSRIEAQAPPAGPPNGFVYLRALAADQSGGDLYATDLSGAFDSYGAIHRFDNTGAYLNTIDGSGTPELQLVDGDPSGVAIDSTTNVLYATNTYGGTGGTGLVDAFDPTTGALIPSFANAGQLDGSTTPPGVFANPCGLGVDQSNGDLYVGDQNHNKVWIFDNTGAYKRALSDSTLNGPCAVAVSSTGVAYVLNSYDGKVIRFSPTGDFAGVAYAPSESDPSATAIALDQANDHLYIDAGDRVDEYDAEGNQLGTFAKGDLTESRGIAAAPSGQIYLANYDPNTGVNWIERYSALLTLPDANTEAATAVEETSATLNGSLDPAGGPDAECHFEYGTDTTYGSTAPCAPAGPYSEAKAVNAAIAGLSAGTIYHFRLVASNANGDNNGADQTFTTAAKPAISGVQGTNALPTELTLKGTIDPKGSATTYHFDYGTSTSYGSQTPSGSLAAANGAKEVQATISGLAPATTYHFRLVAENAKGTSQSADQAINTEPPNSPASPFAYQLVSPADKNGVDVQNILRVSDDGNAIAWTSLGAYADTPGANAEVGYVARRDGAGTWRTTSLLPKMSATDRQGTYFAGAYSLSRDFRTVSITTTSRLDPADNDADPSSPINVQKEDTYRIVEGQAPEWVSGRVDGPPPNAFFDTRIEGTSEDGSTVFFKTPEALSKDVAPGALPCDDGLATCHLYRWRDGQAELVGRDLDGNVLAGSVLGAGRTLSIDGSGHAGLLPDSSAISSDGRSFVYADSSAKDGGLASVYLRRSDGTTVLLSVSQATGTAGQPAPSGMGFVGAIKDLTVIYLRSPDQLTDDAPVGGGIYRYDVATEHLSFAAPGSFQVVSEDGRYLYFTDTSVLAPGATAGQSNFYVKAPDGIHFIAPGLELSVGNGGLTRDGKALVFTTNAQATAYDTAATRQVYLYHADTNALRCVSCNPRQTHSSGEAAIRNDSEYLTPPPNAISDDGTRVVFVSTEALLPADTNGKQDVYEDVNGELRLVSTGTSGFASSLAGISPDGHQILFRTRSSLDPADIDGGLLDIYAARDDVAPTQAAALAPECLGDGCQAPVSATQSSPTPGSAAFSGSGNQKQRKAKKRHHQNKRAHKRAGHDRGGSK